MLISMLVALFTIYVSIIKHRDIYRLYYIYIHMYIYMFICLYVYACICTWGDVKIQEADTATVCSHLQNVAILLLQCYYEISNIGTHCFNTMIYAYLNE